MAAAGWVWRERGVREAREARMEAAAIALPRTAAVNT